MNNFSYSGDNLAAEQVATGVMNVGQQLVDKVRGVPIQLLQRVIYGLLFVWLVLALVQLVWLFVPDTDQSNTPVSLDQGSVVVSNTSQVDVSRLQSLNLFGQVGEQSAIVDLAPMIEEDVPDAVKTKLNLELKGIVSASESSSAVAIIVHKGRQEQYHIGDKLPVGNRVILAKVLNDHVILENNGQYESLWLYDDSNLVTALVEPKRGYSSARSAPLSRNSSIKDMRANIKTTALAKDYRQRLYKNPKSLAEVLRIAPAQQNGQMVGYRVSPGKDKKQFTEFGFKTNDIVTSINDIDLDEPSQALEVYKLMRTATEASFTVLRNGRTLQLMVALGESGE